MVSSELPPGLQASEDKLEGEIFRFITPNSPDPTSPASGYFDAIGHFFSGFDVSGFFSGLSTVYLILSALASLFFMLAIIYIVIQRNRVLRLEEKQYVTSPSKSTDEEEAEERPERPRFESLLGHLESENPSDWRIAIIEADNILFEILDRSGYEGESLGEMLTNATTANFATLENAWEAHKVRNRIAHESDFDLTERETKRVIALYESVFREFEYL